VPIGGKGHRTGAEAALAAAASPKRACSLSRSGSRDPRLAAWPAASSVQQASQQQPVSMPPLSPPACMQQQQQRRFMSGSFTDSHALTESGLDAVAEERECSLSAVSVPAACSR
jgi:hypothetical protein